MPSSCHGSRFTVYALVTVYGLRFTSSNYLEVEPLGGGGAAALRQVVGDDDLEDVLAGREVHAELKAAARPQARHVGLRAGVEWDELALEDRLAVAEDAHLRR